MSAPRWQILPDPATRNVAGSVITHADTGRSVSTGFAGKGLLMPFRRDGKSDFASGSGIELTRAAVALALGTTCSTASSQGELPWRTEFGSVLQPLRLRSNSPALAELVRSRIVESLARWVPSVQLRAVEVRTSGTSLRISIRYDVLDPSGGRVLVPGLETSVALG